MRWGVGWNPGTLSDENTPLFLTVNIDYSIVSFYYSYFFLSSKQMSRFPTTDRISSYTLACTSGYSIRCKTTNANELLVVSEPDRNKSNRTTRSCSSLNDVDGFPRSLSISTRNAHMKSSSFFGLALCSCTNSCVNGLRIKPKHRIYIIKKTVELLYCTVECRIQKGNLPWVFT